MDYIELITVGLILALFIILYFKQPTRMYSVVVRAVISDIEKHQTEIAQRLYNRLPKEVKVRVTEMELITIITYAMSVVLDVLKESSNTKDKK